MAKKSTPQPQCIVIAGPNGAGKTTFARQYLPINVGVLHFVNADLIAGGLSPLEPELAAIAAGRMVLREIDRLAKARADFGFETTLSGLTYVRRLASWRKAGYRVEIVYLRLRLRSWRCGGLLPACVRAATMFRGLMWSGDSLEAGETFRKFIDRLRTHGQFMTTRVRRRCYWRGRHES